MSKRNKANKSVKLHARRGSKPLDAEAQRLFDQAVEATGRRDYVAAERLLLVIEQRIVGNALVSYLLGMVHADTGRLETATGYLEQAVAASPTNPMFQFSLGDAAARLERFQDAAAALRRAIRLDPAFRDAYAALGLVLYKSANYKDARQAFAEALRLDPADARLHMNAAANAIELADESAALKLLTSAERAATGAGAEVLADLAKLYQRLGREEAAERFYREALAADAENPDIWESMARSLAKWQRLDDAIAAFHTAAQLRGSPNDAYRFIAEAAGANGLISESLFYYRKALTVAPHDFDVRSGQLLYHNYLHDFSAEQLFVEHRAIVDCLPVAPVPHFDNPCTQHRKLRIGYVSADFRRHSVAYFIAPVLKNHDRGNVQVYCYFNGDDSDATTAKIRNSIFGWRDIHQLDDAAVIDLIRRDGIDILVDLSGHTEGHRLQVFAQRAAPVQITWLGYPNTTGIPNMDYRLTDAATDPPGLTERFHTEQLLRLPKVFSCYQPDEACTAVTLPPCGQNGHITFGSFNNFNKLNSFVLELWADVLLAVPGSRLLLKDKNFANDVLRTRLLEVFAGKGVDSKRIELVTRDKSKSAHFDRYADMDIALDPYPYCGTTTTCEALWMGVPVVTLAGNDHRSRVGLSQLTAIGLSELVAHDRDEYVAIARRLADNRAQLEVLREGMRERLKASPLMDYPGFTRDLERLYLEAWRDWCEQLPAA